MTPLGHLAIAASAGSGKTFQLAHRYIRLLADDVTPDRICALTFSRKAAGEIFESVVKYLAEAAADDAAAQTISARLAFSESRQSSRFNHQSYLALLRRFVDNLHRLHIGTLDSFMVGVLRAFPAELGLAPHFEVMDADGSLAADLRNEVLQRIFNPSALAPPDRASFFEAFKQATFGREEKSMDRLLDRFVTDHRERYRAIPDEEAWGHRARIWPRGNPWLDDPPDLAAAAAALDAFLANSGWDASALERWHDFVADTRAFGPFAPWSAPIVYMFDRLTDRIEALRTGRAAIKIGRKEYALTAEASHATLQLLRHLVGTEIRTALDITRGLHRVLAQYEALYDDWSRRVGRVTFADAQILLTAANRHSGGAVPGRNRGQPGRLYIDYRLDARLDHWMIDEFQDTSDPQWAALQNLIDEIVQDDSNRRTFFYVGDVKQAIYGWRGGNPRLFARILDQYQPRIVPQLLSTSYRSCAPVIACVNAVFDDLTATTLPPAVQQRWKRIWQPHVAADSVAALPGYAVLLEVRAPDGARGAAEDRYRATAALIAELDPLRRSLQVAVLVRKNDQGRAVVDALRRACPGLPVVHEGKAPLNDSPVTTLLGALLRLATHPGDSLAWRHVQMSPLAPDLAALRADGDVSEPLLRQIHTQGFQPFLRDWGRKLHARIALDAFGLRRLQDLLAAAGEFDATGSRDADAFRRFLDQYAIAESAAGLSVRVMTVHQSKGLGFDVVILPDLQDARGSFLTSGALDLVTARDALSDDPQWVLKMPRRPVSLCDNTLAAQVAAEDERHAFDELCVLYVALTRAKRALYLVTTAAPENSATYTPAALIKHRLTGNPDPEGGRPERFGSESVDLLHETGARNWFASLPLFSPSPGRAELREAFPVPRPPSDSARRSPIEPSSHAGESHSAAWLFSRESRDALNFGSALHAQFERVRWSDDPAPSLEPDLYPGVAEQFQACLRDPAVRALLAMPDGAADLWREQRFELLLDDGQWVRGAFDRVVIDLDAKGRPTRASIIDFKSDRVTDEAGFARAAEGYRPQLELYARAVSQILAIPTNRIARTLVFTRAARVWPL